MKILSVLFVFALFVAANGLAAHLRRANALPADSVIVHSNPHNTVHNQ